MRFSAHDRFWSKVDKLGPVPLARPDLGRCWIWIAHRSEDGYGKFWFQGSAVGAHRWAYQEMRGSLSEGNVTDHLCLVRACVRPSHMEEVSPGENTLRGDSPSARKSRQTHCKDGHLLVQTKLQRKCPICKKAYHRQYMREYNRGLRRRIP